MPSQVAPGGGGAPDEGPAAAGGERATLVPRCRASACDNGLACDGEERCVDDHCVAGEAVTCEPGMWCSETAAEPCVFETPSPWLVAESEGEVWGRRVAELVEGGELVRLFEAPKAASEELVAFDWSPDGSSLVLQLLLPQFRTGIGLLPFGPGLPAEPRRIRELPLWLESDDLPLFSSDSRYAFVYDFTSGTYLVEWGEQPVAKLRLPVAPSGDYTSTEFCAESDTWLERVEYTTYSIARWSDGQRTSRALGDFGDFELSPDRRMLGLAAGWEQEDVVTLTGCGLDEWSAQIPGADFVTFSPSSQLLWVSFTSSKAIYSISDPAHPEQLMVSDNEVLDLTPEMTPDDTRVLAIKDDEYWIMPIGAEPESAVALGIDRYAKPVSLRDDWLLATTDDDETLLWQSLRTPSEPLTLVTSLNAVHPDPRYPDHFLVQSFSDEQTHVLLLDAAADPPQPRELFSIRGVIQSLQIAPDATGIAFIVDNEGVTTPYFAELDASGAVGELRRLRKRGFFLRFQP
jgi:hypothetical protein